MMKKALVFLPLISSFAMANSGADLLIKKNGKSSFSPIVKYQKKIELNNPFLVQLYASWKGLGKSTAALDEMINAILDKDHSVALISLLKNKHLFSTSEKNITEATELYLLWELGLAQNFTTKLIETSSGSTTLKKEFGLALDRHLVKLSAQWFYDRGVILSVEQRKMLKKTTDSNLAILGKINAYAALGTGSDALKWIGKIDFSDPLKTKLADTVILAAAKENKLSLAAKLLKEVYNPILVKTNDVEELTHYHLLLARLLYQAGAYEASEYYYSIIPAKANNFLQARVEKLWISMRSKNLNQLKGEVKSLALSAFEDKFLPEVYLVNAMAALKLCQFSDVEKSFSEFVKVNRKFSKEVTNNLMSENPKAINAKGFYQLLAENTKDSRFSEQAILNTFKAASGFSSLFSGYEADISGSVIASKELIKRDSKRQWLNRKTLLEATIKKMRFVKVEFLSTMRRLNKRVAMKNQDKVKLVSSGLKKTDSFSFPHDGVLFADEIFNISSDVTDLCLRSKK